MKEICEKTQSKMFYLVMGCSRERKELARNVQGVIMDSWKKLKTLHS